MLRSKLPVHILLCLLLLVGLGACVEVPETPDDSSVILGGAADSADNEHLALGNPSGAVADPGSPNNYLISRPQYALSYDRDRGIPNWVSWHLSSVDLGPVERYSGPFITDISLPDGWYRVTHRDYSNSGYDRGHMTPSADRTATVADNEATFILTNVLPQSPENNQGLWSDLEEVSRDLVRDGNELYIVSGGYGSDGTLAGGVLTIPAAVWKVILVLPSGSNDIARIDAQTEVIAIWTPNDAGTAGQRWQDYGTSVACIEQRTGLDFFSVLPDSVQVALEGGSCDGAPAPSQGSAGSGLEPSYNGCVDEPNGDRAPNLPIEIVAVDKAEETVTLRNLGSTRINLDGWIMCSIRGSQQHPITGALAPREVKTFPGPSSNIWSNSESDPGALYDPQGRLVSYWPD